MKLKKQLLTTLIFLSSLLIYSQQINNDDNFPFGFNEKLSFEIQYNIGPAWLKVGSFQLKADTLRVNNILCYHFNSETKTSTNWKWLYNISSHYDAISNISTLKTIKYNQSTTYGRHQLSYDYNFFNDSIYLSLLKDKKLSKLTINNDSLIFDALSALYFARSLDFSNFNINDSIEIEILHGQDILNQKIIFNGIVDLINNDGKIYECFKFTSHINNNEIISDSDPAQVWVTTDKNRLPIKVSTEIFAGTINVFLKEYNTKAL